MKLFFISKIPAFLKINGEFAGIIQENLRCYEHFNEDIQFLEIIPCDSNYEVIYTNLTYKSNLQVYDFLGEKLVVPKFLKKRNLKYKKRTENASPSGVFSVPFFLISTR